MGFDAEITPVSHLESGTEFPESDQITRNLESGIWIFPFKNKALRLQFQIPDGCFRNLGWNLD